MPALYAHLQPTRTGRLIYCDTPLLLTSPPTKSFPLTNPTSQSDLPVTPQMWGPWACPLPRMPLLHAPSQLYLWLASGIDSKPPSGGPSLDTLKCQHRIKPGISWSPSLLCSSLSFIAIYLTRCRFYSVQNFISLPAPSEQCLAHRRRSVNIYWRVRKWSQGKLGRNLNEQVPKANVNCLINCSQDPSNCGPAPACQSHPGPRILEAEPRPGTPKLQLKPTHGCDTAAHTTEQEP